MKREPIAFLWDAIDAANYIERHTKDIDETRFLQDELLQPAVERKFEIIGEALNKLSKLRPDIASQIAELSGAISFRNILAHGYENIDGSRVWRVVVIALPPLRASLKAILKKMQE